jgi:aryl carrier-like protein
MKNIDKQHEDEILKDEKRFTELENLGRGGLDSLKAMKKKK